MPRIVYLLDFEKDKRVPQGLKEVVLVHDDGSTGIVGATNGARTTIFVDLAVTYKAARYMHYSLPRMLIDTLDHEYAHAFGPSGDSSASEEHLAASFDRAGRWARR